MRMFTRGCGAAQLCMVIWKRMNSHSVQQLFLDLHRFCPSNGSDPKLSQQLPEQFSSHTASCGNNQVKCSCVWVGRERGVAPWIVRSLIWASTTAIHLANSVPLLIVLISVDLLLFPGWCAVYVNNVRVWLIRLLVDGTFGSVCACIRGFVLHRMLSKSLIIRIFVEIPLTAPFELICYILGWDSWAHNRAELEPPASVST